MLSWKKVKKKEKQNGFKIIGGIDIKEVVIAGAVRTPIGKFSGSLKEFSATDLGSIAIKGLLEKHGFKPYLSDKTKSYRPDRFKETEKTSVEEDYMDWSEDFKDIEIDEVIMGNVLQGGQGQNPARQASIKAGIPREIPSYTVNKVCGSGMKAVTLASESIKSGESDVIITGGMESMTNAPYILPKARWGYRMDIDTKGELRDLMVLDGLHEIFYEIGRAHV